MVCSLLENDLVPLEVLKFTTKLNYAPYMSIALRIVLTLPISVAFCERSFSKLKLINNYLRTTPSWTRWSDLATLAIEYELSNSLDVYKLIKESSELNHRDIEVYYNRIRNWFKQCALIVFFNVIFEVEFRMFKR